MSENPYELPTAKTDQPRKVRLSFRNVAAFVVALIALAALVAAAVSLALH